MQTSIIRREHLTLTRETADRAGIDRPGDARVQVEGDRLVVEQRAGGKRTVSGPPDRPSYLALRLAPEALDSLGLRNGDVVGIEQSGERRLEVRKLPDPSDPSLTTVDEAGIPVPPFWLIQMVSGAAAPEAFARSGHKVARLFAGLIERHLPRDGAASVMDFGCGCGRVARVLPGYLECEITGCDITPAAIEWCTRNLPGEYMTSTPEPPLPVAAERFDVLYAISVLTHLDERHQDAWLGEWQRIVRPGGLLLVTYRGEGHLARMGSAKREEIDALWQETGMVFVATDYWEGLFPEFYGGAYHKGDYVRARWGSFFEVLELLPATDTGLVQDLAVLRRRPAESR